MFSSRVIIVQVVVVACLASVALSASVGTSSNNGGMVCDACKQVVAQAKANMPAAKEQLEQLKGLCKACGAEENVKKCEKAIEDVIHKLETETPEQICTELQMCGKRNFLTMFGM